jgi:uncharacterized membrane protein
MPKKTRPPIWQALGLGVLAGMRSASAPAVASHILSRRPSGHLAKSTLDFMQSKRTAVIFKILAASELIADKLPSAPNRIKPIGVVFRCISGSLAGASIYKASGKNMLTGALLGSAAALGSTFGSFFIRKNTVNRLNLFDPIAGGVEDVLVVGAGVGLAYTA